VTPSMTPMSAPPSVRPTRLAAALRQRWSCLVALALAGVLVVPAAAQGLRSTEVQVAGGYHHALSLTEGVQAAAGPGVTARLHAPLVRGFGVSGRLGLDWLAVEQDDPIPRWDWGYWEALWATWSETYRTRPDMDAVFRPVQHAILIGGAVGPSFSVGGERHSVTLWAGPSLTYYTRRLYNEETWSRRYDSIEHTFAYTIRNYAPDKTGLVLGADAGVSGSYRVAPWLGVSGGVSLRRLQLDPSPELPINDLVSLDLGFSVRY
jgi:hypothetical protein